MPLFMSFLQELKAHILPLTNVAFDKSGSRWCANFCRLMKSSCVLLLSSSSFTLQVSNWELWQNVSYLGHRLRHWAAHTGGSPKCGVCHRIQQPLRVWSYYSWEQALLSVLQMGFHIEVLLCLCHLETRLPLVLLIRPASCGVLRRVNASIRFEAIWLK